MHKQATQSDPTHPRPPPCKSIHNSRTRIVRPFALSAFGTQDPGTHRAEGALLLEMRRRRPFGCEMPRNARGARREKCQRISGSTRWQRGVGRSAGVEQGLWLAVRYSPLKKRPQKCQLCALAHALLCLHTSTHLRASHPSNAATLTPSRAVHGYLDTLGYLKKASIAHRVLDT